MKSQKHWIFRIFLTAITTLILASTLSCRHDSNEIDLLGEVSFKTDIEPIFQINCAKSGCHNQAGESYAFNSYQNIMEAITPGDPYGSPAYKSLFKIWSIEGMMPPDQPLTEHNRTLIRVWIQKGAKDN